MANALQHRETTSHTPAGFEERLTAQQGRERSVLRAMLRLALIFVPICIIGYVAIVAIAVRNTGQSLAVMIAPAAALGVLFAVGVVGLCIGAVFANEALSDQGAQPHGAE